MRHGGKLHEAVQKEMDGFIWEVGLRPKGIGQGTGEYWLCIEKSS